MPELAQPLWIILLDEAGREITASGYVPQPIPERGDQIVFPAAKGDWPMLCGYAVINVDGGWISRGVITVPQSLGSGDTAVISWDRTEGK